MFNLMVARMVEREPLKSSEMGGNSLCDLFKVSFEVKLHLLLRIAAAKTASYPTVPIRGAPPLQLRGGGEIMKPPPPLVFEAYK